MPSNLEVKAACADVESARRIAVMIGAVPQGSMDQVDTYFRVPEGRLKLREIRGVRSELISYRREEGTNARVSRFETCPVTSPENLKRVLETLLPVRAVVRKKRSLYLYKSTRIHIDTVEDLGTFIEFEIPREDPEHNPEAILELLVDAFGIREGDFLRHSYVDMLDRG